MWNFLALTSLLLLAPAEVTIESLDGSRTTGQLISLSGDMLTVESSEGPVEIPFQQLLTVQPITPPDPLPAEASSWIELLDGSLLEATAVEIKEGTLEATIRSGARVSIKTRNIRYTRLVELDPEKLADFQQITKAEAEGDVLIIRRPSGALDELEGIVHSLDDTILVFEFDDEKIQVERTKIAGIRYFQAGSRKLPEPRCLVSLAGNVTLFATTLELAEQQLTVTCSAGPKVTIPLDQLVKLDFSAGNLVYLSDLEPETIKWTPYLSTGKVNERLTRLYRPRRDRTLSGKALVLANQSFPKGLAIHSRTEMTYRLTSEFQVFQSLVGIDPALGENGDVDLVVIGNGKQLFRKKITGKDEAIELKIDVRGVSRLTILVDFGEQLDIGDHLLLCNARLTK
tara:strand:- start:3181 stop:4377 length:1197 start_codon:yes stop_codon:yes gene_type:complete